jgi:iron(III) transport system ATP-binding protein
VRGQRDDEVATAVGDVLALVGLAGYEHQFSGQLSGGEQQRVALARAIVIRPRVLLFDEPLSNLDAKLRVEMRQEIRALQRRLAITTVYVTHDQEEAMAVSDRIAVMSAGTVVQEGSAEDLYHRPASEFVARFVGRVNLLPGRGGAARRGVESRCSAERWRSHGAAGLIGRRRAAGGAPESIIRRAASRQARCPRSSERAFLGEKSEYVVRCAGEPLQVVRYDAPPAAPSPPARVGVGFSAGRSRCCREPPRCPAAAACVGLAASVELAAQPAPEVHGMADAFGAPGVALAWAVLRDAGGGDATVVIRVAVERERYAALAVAGIDPFTHAARTVLEATPIAGSVDVAVPRAQFADFPRTELRLFASRRRCAPPALPWSSTISGPRHDAGVHRPAGARALPHGARHRRPHARHRQAAMTRHEFARLLDHSVLKPESTQEDIHAGAVLVRSLAIGFYCVQPCWVANAATALAGTDARVVAVVGFPHGCDAGEVKARAAAIAIDDGAGEIDMVMNIGALPAPREPRRRRHRGRGHCRPRPAGQGDPRDRGADRQREDARLPARRGGRRRVRQDLDRLPSLRRCDGRRRPAPARRGRHCARRQGLGRNPYAGAGARDARRRRQPDRQSAGAAMLAAFQRYAAAVASAGVQTCRSTSTSARIAGSFSRRFR